jgi:hypothetical protein
VTCKYWVRTILISLGSGFLVQRGGDSDDKGDCEWNGGKEKRRGKSPW